MRELPQGTVAFLFGDIEGSTRILQRLGNDYSQVLDRYFELAHAAIANFDGVEVKTMGDGFFVAFSTAPQALGAAVELQRSVAGESWPPGGMVRVRMGLHVGTPTILEGDYTGLDVHRSARVCDAAHGGQILVSATAQALLGQQPGPGVDLEYVGRHRLKGVDAPEHLYNVALLDLPCHFPPPRSQDARPHNLPSEVTPFVGREEELSRLVALVREHRLITLAGPGGVGKTRLALRLAREALPQFEHGAFFVPLADLQDAAAVANAITQCVGAKDRPGEPPLEVLADHLRQKELLLVLDNFEQLVDAAGDVTFLLEAAPGLTAVVTSRTLLRSAGEHVFEVASLDVPPRDVRATTDELMRFDSVNLFVTKVAATDPQFRLTPRNAPIILDILHRLDGLPFAIELAAVRCRLFPPEALAERLARSFDVLKGGSRETPDRHQTVRNAISWSYDLHGPAEQALFRRLGVFAGGFTIDAAEEVAAGEPVSDVLDSLSLLLDSSLLQRGVVNGETRLSMLETVSEFASRTLSESGEGQALAERHARWFARLAAEVGPHLSGHGHAATVDRLSAEQANLQAALAFCQDTADMQTGLQIAVPIWRFWEATGQFQEGRRWLEGLLSKPGVPAGDRAHGLQALAGLTYWQGEYGASLVFYREALELFRQQGDEINEADTLLALSTTHTWSGDTADGRDLADDALAMFERLGARDKIGMALMAQGFARWKDGDLEAARPLWVQSQEIAREVGDSVEVATKSMAIASIDFNLGRHDEALSSVLEAMEDLIALKCVTFTIMAIDWVAAIVAPRDPVGGLRLAGAAAALRDALGGGMHPEASGLKSAQATARPRLDQATADRLFAEGAALGFEEAVAAAREVGLGALQMGVAPPAVQ